MKEEWQTRTLGDVCDVVNGGTPKTVVPEYWGGRHLWITPAEMGKRRSPYVDDTERKITGLGLRDSSARMLPLNSIILSSRAPIGYLVINTKPMSTNQGCKGLIPGKQLQHMFLYYYLISIVDLLNSLGTGATFKEISGSKLKEVVIPVPPLPEQRRIVAILDEASANIATAIADAEKNLQNAHALFESHFHAILTRYGEEWDKQLLVSLCSAFVDSAHRTPKYQEEGIPALRPRDVVNGRLLLSGAARVSQAEYKIQSSRYKPIPGDIVYSRELSYGWAALLPEAPRVCLSQGMCIFRPKSTIDTAFLLYILNGPIVRAQAVRAAVGAAHPHINLGDIKSYLIPLPDLDMQRQLVRKLDALTNDTQRLESIYQQKLAALDELKKSLLHQAFCGELTSRAAAISVPVKIPGISTTDLHAGILAIAYQAHEKTGKQESFGHVKAEKIIHMIEAHAGIDMDRTPIKDAAGPNDYAHLLKVESRARKAGFFDFRRNGDRYRVTKLSGFDRLVVRTREKLGDRIRDIDRLIELMLHMDTQQAEIFCTVYASWNNLLLDGQQPTDEVIVHEARENWHREKMKIPRDRFFRAIMWMREKKVTPTGKGKKVTTRQKAS